MIEVPICSSYFIALITGDTLFKAKAQRADVEDAEVVVESQDTEVERPLDLEEPEVVEEEETKEERHTNNTVTY